MLFCSNNFRSCIETVREEFSLTIKQLRNVVPFAWSSIIAYDAALNLYKVIKRRVAVGMVTKAARIN